MALGTTSGTALAGNTTIPDAALLDVSGTPTLKSGITGAEVRTAIGAGTSSLALGTTSGTALAGNTTIPDAALLDVSGTPTLKSGITGAEVRTAIGAGTSSLALGTTSGTALAGDTDVGEDNQVISISVSGAGDTKVLRLTIDGTNTDINIHDLVQGVTLFD